MMSGEGEGACGALTRSRVSAEQLDLLLTFMEEHPDFAAGKQSVYSRFSASKLWRLLAERLNAAADDTGGARKSPDKWCRYWADIKYKARKKSAAGLGELSSVDERLRSIIDKCAAVGGTSGGGGGGGAVRRSSHSDEERKPPLAMDDDGCSETSAGGERLATEELLAEAAMRSALAAEKQAEAVAQGVELLRELVALVRERPPSHSAHAPPQPPPSAVLSHDPLHAPLHHHHRL